MCIVYSKFLSNYSINQCQFLKILFHVKHKLLSLQFCKFFQDLSVFYLLRNRDELIQKKIYLYAQELLDVYLYMYVVGAKFWNLTFAFV
jgi:hypothetical protein